MAVPQLTMVALLLRPILMFSRFQLGPLLSTAACNRNQLHERCTVADSAAP